MKMKAIAAAILMSAAPGYVLANDYQTEVGVAYHHFDPDEGGSERLITAEARFFFAPVETATLPLAEAAFMQRASSVYLTGGDASFDYTIYGGGLDLFIINKFLYIGGFVAREEIDDEGETDWVAKVGIAPIDGLLLTTLINEDDYEFNLQLKYVAPLGGENFLNLEANYADGGDFEDQYSAYVDFYFDRTFSLGVGYEDDGYDDDGYTIRTRKFFNHSFSGEAAYTKFDNYFVASVGVSLRF